MFKLGIKPDFLKKKFLFKNVTGYMDPSEITVMVNLIDKLKPDVVIESGRMFGVSTYFLAEICTIKNIKFISIDLEVDKKINLFSRKLLNNFNISFLKANSYHKIPFLIEKYKKKKIALIIDGPKGSNIFFKIISCMMKYNNLEFVFIDNKNNIPKKYINLNLKKIFEFKDLIFKKKDKIYLSKINNVLPQKEYPHKKNDFIFFYQNALHHKSNYLNWFRLLYSRIAFKYL